MDNNNPNQNNQRNVKDARSRAKADGGKSPRKKLLWNILLIAIIALTIWAITSQEGFSIKEFWEYLTSLNPVFLILAILSMLAVIFFEVLYITKDFFPVPGYSAEFSQLLRHLGKGRGLKTDFYTQQATFIFPLSLRLQQAVSLLADTL